MARGDADALAALYDRYAPLMLGLGTKMLGSRRGAEDLLHDVFMEAWRKADSYDPERGSVRSWLLLRTRSRALDRLRSAEHTRVTPTEPQELPEDKEAPAPADPSLAPDRAAARAAVAALNDDQRVVIELAYFRGLSSSEIAQQVGIPIGTVKSRTRAAMKALRESFSVGVRT